VSSPGSARPTSPDLELFRAAMQSAGVGFSLLSPEGQFLEVNAALCQLLGRDAAALCQATWQELTHPDDLATDLALVEALKANQRQSYRLRKRYLRPDGSVLWGDLNVSCLRHGDGRVRLFVAQIVDISAVVAAEDALAEREQQLREQANRLELATETVGLGIFDADLRSGGVFYSEGFLRNLGYDPGDWRPSQEEWFSRAHPEELEQLQEAYQAVQDGSTRTMEYRLRHRDGTYRWCLGSGKGIDLDASGRARRIVGFCLDISERKRAEQRLHATQQQLEVERRELRATLDGLLEPHILLKPVRDDDGRIVDFLYHDANPAACAYNRMTREQLVGMSLLGLLPAHQATGLIDHYSQVVDRGQALVLNDYAYPNDFLGEERRYDIRAVRVGELLSYSWRDVTERHRSAQQLAASERRFRLLAENATDVVLHLREGRIVWVSPSVSRVLGWQPDDWLGRPGSDFLEAADQSAYAANLELLAAGQPVAARNRIRARDGSWHWMDTRASVFLDEHGQPDGILAAGRLVDAEVKAEQALERKSRELASKLRTSLTASVVAHEINQPLSMILLQAQLALQAAQQVGTAAAPLQEPLTTLIGETQRVDTTIERMRMLLRNVQTSQEELDLAVVLGNALLYLQPQLLRQGVRLRRGGEPGPLWITGDAAQLQLAINNLLRNSLEALGEAPPTGAEPCITVSLERLNGTIALQVADNGPGFGDLDLSTLPLSTTKRQGMGLGLYVVQTTTENHGGSLEIGSCPELGGAAVTLCFPLQPAAAAAGG
jgi:PAS domain S-box-containing protein